MWYKFKNRVSVDFDKPGILEKCLKMWGPQKSVASPKWGVPKKILLLHQFNEHQPFRNHLGGETPPPLSLAAKARHPAAAAAKLRRQLRTAETNLRR